MLPSGVLESGCAVLASFRSFRCGVSSRQGFDEQLCRPALSLARKSGCHYSCQVWAVISETSASDNAGDSAADFVKRTERAWMISKAGVRNACGAREPASSFWVTLCFVKCLHATLLVSSVLGRELFLVKIVKAQASEHSGWDFLRRKTMSLTMEWVSLDIESFRHLIFEHYEDWSFTNVVMLVYARFRFLAQQRTSF